MNSRELVHAAIRGETTPRRPCGPLAVHYTASLAGVSVRDYTLDPEIMADCIARYYERFRPDAVWLSADTWVTAEAMGAEVGFPGENQPMSGTGRVRIRCADDIDAIPPADPFAQGRMPLMIEALRLLRRRLGEDVFIVGCFDQSPFSLACALAGMSDVMLRLYDDPGFVEALLDRAVEYGSAYARALGRAGADLLSTGDSPAGLLGTRLYGEVALPAERRVFEAIAEDCGIPVSLHICGNTTHILPDMARSGAHVLELDAAVDLGEACGRIPENIAIWGNLDPVALLRNGSPAEIEDAASRAIRTCRRNGRERFVLSSGCTLCPDTPEENVEALIRAARA
jgi:uroporphyrinogen decarboxylase